MASDESYRHRFGSRCIAARHNQPATILPLPAYVIPR
jgi:hypothetical protein